MPKVSKETASETIALEGLEVQLEHLDGGYSVCFESHTADADLADLSAYYAAQAPRPRAQAVDPAKAAEGKRLATLHNCTSCHRPDLSGQHQVPRVAGQDLAYLLKLLRAYKAQTAGDLEGLMTQAAQPLSEADIENLAHFMAILPAPPP